MSSLNNILATLAGLASSGYVDPQLIPSTAIGTKFGLKRLANNLSTSIKSVKPVSFFRYGRKFDMDSKYGVFTPASLGGVTVLVKLEPAKNQFTFSFSVCGKDDRFCKKTGREMCESRFQKGEVAVITDIDDTMSVLDNIATNLRRHLKGEDSDLVFKYDLSVGNKIRLYKSLRSSDNVVAY